MSNVRLHNTRCFYVHNCMMDVFSGLMQWFNDSYFTGFATQVLGGYDRAIREIQNSLAKNTDPDKPLLPAISLQPLGDMTSDPKFPHLWRLQDIGEHYYDMLIDPHYEDEHFAFSVVAHRFQGNFEVILYLNSPYDYLDHYLQSIMFFHGGYNRRVRPGLIQTNVIIPDQVITTAYDGTPYDWTNSGVTNELVRALNKNHFLFPMVIGPQIWMTSIANASTIYGEDALSTYKIQITCEYDVDIPTHIIVRADDRIQKMNIKLMTSDPVWIPKVPTLTTDENQIIIDVDSMKDAPEDILGPYFKKVRSQEYHEYMFGPKRMSRVCNGENMAFHAMVQYKFDRDVTFDEGYQIDISAANLPINAYDKIIVGDRIGMLIYGTAYEIDHELTGTIITVKMDVPKDRIWDILLYKTE